MVQRAAERDLVREVAGNSDRRFAKVHLTRQGTTILERISRANIAELRGPSTRDSQESPQHAARHTGCLGHLIRRLAEKFIRAVILGRLALPMMNAAKRPASSYTWYLPGSQVVPAGQYRAG